MQRNSTRLILVSALVAPVFLLSACGFYLKGQRPASKNLQSVSVRVERPYRVGDPALVMALKNRLRAQDKWVDKGAETRIQIKDIQNLSRTLSISPIDGRVSEVELEASAQFSISHNGEPLVTAQRLSVRRAYSFDNTERLASEAEQDDLIATMQTELADLILLRAETALTQAQISEK